MIYAIYIAQVYKENSGWSERPEVANCPWNVWKPPKARTNYNIQHFVYIALQFHNYFSQL